MQNRAVWFRLVHLGADYCNLGNLVKIGATWCRLVQFGASWGNLVQLRVDWFYLVENGRSWCNLVQIAKIALGQKVREMSYEERCILLSWSKL